MNYPRNLTESRFYTLKLRKWVNRGRLLWPELCKNENALDYLKVKKKNIVWNELCYNTAPGIIEFLEENIEKVVLENIIHNQSPDIIKVLEKKIKTIEISNYCKWNLNYIQSSISTIKSPYIADFLSKNTNFIDWNELCENPSPGIIEILKKNINRINWVNLSMNPGPGVLEFLKDHITHVHWSQLCRNENPGVIQFIEEITQRLLQINVNQLNDISTINIIFDTSELLKKIADGLIDSYNISSNTAPGVIEFLKKNPRFIHWGALSKNEGPGIIEFLDSSKLFSRKIKLGKCLF